MKRDYDSTVARIAGNIAAGLVTTPHFRHECGVVNHAELVAVSVDLARRIIATLAQQQFADQTPETKA